MEKVLICKNCQNTTFYELHTLAIGKVEGKETQWQLLKCMKCGEVKSEKTETIR